MKTKNELVKEHHELTIKKMKMDRFFTLYLDKFGSKMDADKPNTKIWSLYKSKLKEYDDLNRSIKYLDYWISK